MNLNTSSYGLRPFSLVWGLPKMYTVHTYIIEPEPPQLSSAPTIIIPTRKSIWIKKKEKKKKD